MNKRFFLVLVMLLVAGALLATTWLVVHTVGSHSLAVLDPKGPIAAQQKELMRVAGILMLIVAVPVFAMTFGFAWYYRASNKKATYTPTWDHNFAAEAVWWGIPCVIITILAVMTWQSTHALDPFKPLESSVKPITIQVVALDWKWLFIYPEQNVASVNQFSFPAGTPINFVITADAPMNSFWIPQLGGQVYAMAGMTTKLHLMADAPGTFSGSSANLSGKGFAGMNFTATATTADDFTAWVKAAKASSTSLTLSEYEKLATPSENTPPLYYAAAEKNLHHSIMMKFMSPMDETSGFDTMDMNTMHHSVIPQL